MNIAVIGAGNLGIATATSLSLCGHDVVCFDRDEHYVAELSRGMLPFAESEFNELLRDAAARSSLRFTSERNAAVTAAEMVFLAVDTLVNPNGRSDLRELLIVTDMLMHHLRRDAVLAIKSLVPCGTNQRIARRIDGMTWQNFDVASNPVVSKSANWLDDVFTPKQILLGCRDQETADSLQRLYAPMQAPVVFTSPESVEWMSCNSLTPFANAEAQAALVRRIEEMFGDDLSGMKFAVWGVPAREAMPSKTNRRGVCLFEWLTERGACVAVHDPVVNDRQQLWDGQDRIHFVDHQMDAIKQADALVILKGAGQYRAADPGWLTWHLRDRVVFDGCRCQEGERLKFLGFRYFDADSSDALRERPQSPRNGHAGPRRPSTRRATLLKAGWARVFFEATLGHLAP